jgi:Transposase DDE domain
MRKLRQTTVEPVPGTLINFFGLKRMNTRGVRLASKCMIMVAIAYNLKKLLKYSVPKAKASVKQIGLLKNNCLEMLYACYGSLLCVIKKGRMKSNQSFYCTAE